jgi:hypothetical protein
MALSAIASPTDIQLHSLLQAIADVAAKCVTEGDAFGCAFAHAAAEAWAFAFAKADAAAFALAVAECKCYHTETKAAALAFGTASYFKTLYVEAAAEASTGVCAGFGACSISLGV